MRRALTLALVAAAVLHGACADGKHPVAVVGHAGVSLTTTTTTAAAPAPTTTSTTRPSRVAATTVVRTEQGRVTVVNEGSAEANTGGNTAIGPPDTIVVTGPASAVGSRP